MQITPIQQYRTQNIQPKAAPAKSNINFQGLHVTKQVLKRFNATPEGFLKNKNIKDCAERAEIIIEPRYKYPCIYNDREKNAYRKSRLNVVVADRLENGKPKGRIHETILYNFKDLYIDYLGRRTYYFIERLIAIGEPDFREVMNKYQNRSLSDTKTFLDILNEDIVKEKFTNGDIFNYPLKVSRYGDRGLDYYWNIDEDTLLTKFFDIVPLKDNEKEYKQIIDIMKNMPGIIYNQKDDYKITVLEKILNSENPYALELIKNYEFPYSVEVHQAYNNIFDEDFKNKATNALKFKFGNDIISHVLGNPEHIEERLNQILALPFFKKEVFIEEALDYAREYCYIDYFTKTLYPVLMKYGLLSQEQAVDFMNIKRKDVERSLEISIKAVDKRIKEIESNQRRYGRRNNINYDEY